jgi:hypothetical protein
VGVARRLAEDGKEESFWHLVTEGPDERSRTPDPRRCERIAWPRALIEALGRRDPDVVAWSQLRPRQRTLVISVADFSYVVVLADRRTHYLLITAFCVEHERRRGTYRREWEREARQ